MYTFKEYFRNTVTLRQLKYSNSKEFNPVLVYSHAHVQGVLQEYCHTKTVNGKFNPKRLNPMLEYSHTHVQGVLLEYTKTV